jgi:hypothetical protein
MPARNAYSNLAVGASKTMAEVEMFAGHVLMNPQELKKAAGRLHGNACAGMKRVRNNSRCWVCSNKTEAERAGRSLHTQWCCSKCPKTKKWLRPDCFFRSPVHKSYLVTAVTVDEDGDARAIKYFLAFFANF